MNPINVEIVGQALNTFGLQGNDTISGVGLNTFGFLWPVNGFWLNCPCSDDAAANWTDDCCDDSEASWASDCCDDSVVSWNEDCC